MSDSRLEKFIYAICSMDVSDLPVPLSRIEKLWNCLITGETPDFEPLSRNEKYLMAMLDRYDISNLPAPMSRGEKLLYKIVVGETDLSDVPGYLSRYEELLKYLIENGGISEGDFEYVLYTLNQSMYTLYTTAEKPVKSAILKGNTLVNLSVNKGYTTLAFTTTETYKAVFQYNIESYKPNTKYLVITEFNHDYKYNFGVNIPHASAIFNENILIENGVGRVYKHILTTKSDLTGCNTALRTVVYNNTEETDFSQTFRIMIIEYQEGMENWDIPYFEGMQSVKMPVLTTTGKNLFNPNAEFNMTDGMYGFIKLTNNKNNSISIVEKDSTVNMSGIYFGLTGNGLNPNQGCKWLLEKGILIITEINNSSYRYFSFYPNDKAILNKILQRYDIQFEESVTTTSYEPHKSNILTADEEIELGAVGEVQDTLDLLTGEVIERTDEITLDVTNVQVVTNDTSDRFEITSKIIPKNNQYITKDNSGINNWGLTVLNNFNYGKNNTISYHANAQKFFIRFESGLYTAESLKQKLIDTPLTLRYELATESIKTVDLTVVDQDNQPTQLGTFENVTHVSLEAENLIPEVEMEVATNLLEDTVFNLTNAFNTLYPTAAKPVKSAILTGQTLVNIKENQVSIGQEGRQVEYEIPLVKTNTNYFIKYKLTSTSSWVAIGFLNNSLTWSSNRENQPLEGQFILNSGTNPCYFRIGGLAGTTTTVDYLMVIEYQEGMENWDIPYFEGMQSVKMPSLMTTGKNLLNITPNALERITISGTTGEITESNTRCTTKYIKATPKDDLFLKRFNTNYKVAVRYYYNDMSVNKTLNTNGNFISDGNLKVNHGDYYNQIRLIFAKSDDSEITPQEVSSQQIMLTSSQNDVFEPYKTNILTTSEEVELRGIGDVRDELNCLTGEVVERIGEVVFDGNEGWQNNTEKTNTRVFRLIIDNLKRIDHHIISDRFPTNASGDVEKITNTGNTVYVAILRSKADDLKNFKSYLSQNPITAQYQLATESIKTVDLSVVDQDGNVTTLKTFDDTTHVLLNSEGLIPTASLTVRTKIPSASSTSLLMDDISTEQQQLETTVDEQSNNVDATMIATTEIYEETL